MDKKIEIEVFVMPTAVCSYEKSWQYAVDLISRRLKTHLGDVFNLKIIEIFSPESFSYKEILEGIQKEALQTPVVAIEGNIVQSGGKLSEGKIRAGIEQKIAQISNTN